MDTELLTKIGLSELQSKIYLYLISQKDPKTPTEIADDLGENRTTVYSAAEKLEALGLISKKEKGKITAYIPNHPSCLEILAEKRLRHAAKQVKNVEMTLPSLINIYNENQHEPGVVTLYGQEGIDYIYNKILETKETEYFIRSRFDEIASHEKLAEFKKKRERVGIHVENITPSEFIIESDKEARKNLRDRTFLPPNEYDSPVEINIFGNYVTFTDYTKDGMSTIIESPAIADAMRQFFKFSRKYIRIATKQSEISDKIEERLKNQEKTIENINKISESQPELAKTEEDPEEQQETTETIENQSKTIE